MGTISTGIELNDNFSSVLYNIMGSVNLAIYQMEEMRQSLSASIDTSYIEGARESIDRATMSLREMEEAASVSVAPAMSSMDVSAANSNYEQLRQNVESTGQHIRDNAEEQQRFNQAVNSGTTSSNNLLKGLIGLHVVQSVVNTVTGQIDAAMKRMDTMTNFQRTMTAITGSSDMAAASLNQLKDITTGTAYGLDVAAMAVQNFTTRGMGIGNATSEVGKWADAVAFYGDGTNESLTTVTDALGKMMTKGIALIFAVCTAIAKMTGVANTGFGVICGGINVVIELFKNLGLGIADFAIGAGLAINALAQNIMTAFGNAIRAVQSWWYGLLSTVMTVISGICAQLNKLPFVEFDYSGVTEAANKYAGKAAELAGQKGDYESISDAFKEGWNTFDIFPKNWVNNAFNKGSEWGDDKMNKLSGLLDGFGNIPNADDYLKGYGDDSTNNLGDTLDKSGTGNKVADIANSAGNIENTLTATSEDLKYLRDIAERDTINRFTTAEISIVQTNNNKIASDMDLDGVVEGLTSAVDEAISNATEGVH